MEYTLEKLDKSVLTIIGTFSILSLLFMYSSAASALLLSSLGTSAAYANEDAVEPK